VVAWSSPTLSAAVAATQGCSGQTPCTNFQLVESNGSPEVINFKIKTTFTNLYHVSDQATWTL
jgi:hypothetical protein